MAEGSEQQTAPGTPGFNISSSSRTRISNEEASVEMSNFLNILGYGKELIQKRRECFRANDINFNAQWNCGNTFESITVGSKAEGLSRCFESDRDVLVVINSAKCLEAGCDVNFIPENTPVFRMDTQICYPGHCILLLERGLPLLLCFVLCDNGHGQFLLRSDVFLNRFRMGIHDLGGPVLQEPMGPSLPISMGHSKFDTVLALRGHCPSILQRWATRSRHWPPTNIVDKVVSMGVFLTPVGFKGSENRNIEWRICFNTGETELIINLNDTCVKLYLLLKMIAKDVLKPRHKEITSYMLKNIILWLAENNPQSVFYPRSLFFWLRESLLHLRTALSKKQLPCYMIPDRNLMAACGLTDAQQRTWIKTLTDMMDEGPLIIRRLPKIRKAIIAHPEPLIWFNARRFEMEMIVLEAMKSCPCNFENMIGNVFIHMVRHGLLWRFMEILWDVFVNTCSEECTDLNTLFHFLPFTLYKLLN